MIDALIHVYLAAPVLFALAVFFYGVTRAPDRIQLATVCLFACALLYAAAAYSLVTQESTSPVIGVALAAYAAVLYVTVGALAFYTKLWAWRVALAAFALHLLAGLVGSIRAFGMSGQIRVALLLYFAVGAIGLWATLHKGTRSAVGITGRAAA